MKLVAMNFNLHLLAILTATLAMLPAARSDAASIPDRPDLLIADFEGLDFGGWQVSGDAFGTGPAHGALPNQMPVTGFIGNGFVSSYHGGDGHVGTLTSPPLKIERRYLQFLIGGGGWAGKTCFNLLCDGKIVRSATGTNTRPGGSEQLDWQAWDVGDLAGKTIELAIVDQATDGWGHISVDQIVQSDFKRAGVMLSDAKRSFKVENRYLNLPVKNGAAKRVVRLEINGRLEREFDIELADGQPDWWAFMDATPFKGETITLTVDRLAENSQGLSSIVQSEKIKDGQTLYRELRRPQFHFTARRGWLNDPNGLVFYRGEYHLFFQHNPYGWDWGNMHWGHAVSKDLVHWQELPEALYPDEHGTMFSGSAVVDWNNTAGFQAGKEPALVAMVTAAGKPFTQEIAYSTDRGRIWTKYEHNPVLGHIAAENRDPKVVWFAPGKKWVMALYLDHSDYALFSSLDLKSWQKLSDVNLPGDSECPNFFQVPLDGNPQNMRWVFFGASGVYVVGKFDGQKFAPETKPQRLHNGNCWYAAQVYSDIPANDGRCILVPWGRLPDGELFRGMTFNQMMGLPVELTLHSNTSGMVLAVNPVRELKSLRQKTHTIKPQILVPGFNPLADLKGDLCEIEAEIAVGDAKSISFDLRGVLINYNVAAQKISCLGSQVSLVPNHGKILLHLFVDRASVDIYGGDGSLYLPMAKAISADNKNLKLTCEGGSASIASLNVYELKSAWE